MAAYLCDTLVQQAVQAVQAGCVMEATDGRNRRAPYAPISALREFFERIRNVAVPSHVDKRFLQKLNVASNNEWALLSALKFLGVVDEHGAPTHAYRLLQTTDRFEDTLRHLVEKAYEPLLEVGGANMSSEDLQNYFRVTSSPSQAKNATRFFLEVCKMAGITANASSGRAPVAADPVQPAPPPSGAVSLAAPQDAGRPCNDVLLAAKANLLEKLPAPRPDWTAAEYQAICDRFLEMLRNLDGESP